MRTTPEHLAAEYRASGAWSSKRVGDMFVEAAALDPQRMAVIDPPNRPQLDGNEPRRLDWRSLSALVDTMMVALTDAGLRRDDVLITQLPNIAEYVAVYLACARLGVIVSPVAMQFRRAELQPISELTRARALLTVRKFKDADPASAALSLTNGPKILVLGPEAPAGAHPLLLDPKPEHAARAAALEQAAAVDADEILTICWTSGTEGVPKGVPRSHNHWIAGSVAHFDGAGIRQGDRLLNPFPLINMAGIGGCFMSWLRCAGTLVLHHPFDLPVYLRQIATEKPEYAIAPPAVLMMLLQNESLLSGVDLTCLRCIGSGSAPLAPSMIKAYKDKYGIEIINNFGSNEGVALCCGPLEAPEPDQRATLFPRFGRLEVDWPQRIAKITHTRLIDPDTGAEVLEPGKPGEMQVRGPVVFDGYFGMPQLNATAFTADGWFRSGDLFVIDESGRYYRFVGRLKQMINRGGMKISPEELDAVLAEHPDIAEGAIVGYPDEVLGQRICAVVVPKPGRTVSLESVQKLFEARGLAIFKRPERIKVVAQLPRNPLGKVVRADIERAAATEEDVARTN
jgi:acyl-CoA synthetase (AMP-forming)/AMP-acid ligase II